MKANLEKKLEKIKLLFRIQDYRQAEELLEALFKEYPGIKSEEGLDSCYAVALYKQNKLDQAIASLRDSLKDNPESMELHLCLATSLCDQGFYEEAQKVFTHSKKLGFNSYKKKLEFDYNKKLAELHDFLGESEKSLKHLEHCSSNETASLETQLQAAASYIENKMYSKAIFILTKLIQKYEPSTASKTLLGLAYHLKGESGEADKTWREALVKNPNAREPRILLDNLEK